MPSQLKSGVGTFVHCRCSRNQQSDICGVVFLQTKRENSLCPAWLCVGGHKGWEAEAVAASMAKQFCSGTCGRGSLSVGSKISVPTNTAPEELSMPLQKWSCSQAAGHGLRSVAFCFTMLLLLWRGLVTCTAFSEDTETAPELCHF